MSFISEVILLFKTARESFLTINGTSGNDNMILIHETLLNTCLSVCFVGTDTGCASGVVLRDNAYQGSNTNTFNCMLSPITAYDPDITVFEGAHHAYKQKWLSKLTNQSIIRSTKKGGRELIIQVIKDTWTCRLKGAKTFYSCVTPLALLEILADRDGGLERSDAITLPLRLPSFWTSNTRVPEYTHTMEDAQKKAIRLGLPFSDDLLTAFATHFLLTAKSFPKYLPEWDGKPAA